MKTITISEKDENHICACLVMAATLATVGPQKQEGLERYRELMNLKDRIKAGDCSELPEALKEGECSGTVVTISIHCPDGEMPNGISLDDIGRQVPEGGLLSLDLGGTSLGSLPDRSGGGYGGSRWEIKGKVTGGGGPEGTL